jgi:hypothetical protein
MRDMSSVIREKPNWREKIKDKKITDKWIKEI